MVHDGENVVLIGGTHSLHHHEKIAIAVSKAMRGHSLQETKKDGRFHVHTKTYLDGALLKEVCSSFCCLCAHSDNLYLSCLNCRKKKLYSNRCFIHFNYTPSMITSTSLIKALMHLNEYRGSGSFITRRKPQVNV